MISTLKYPFAWHPVEGIYKTPTSVPKGNKSGCICRDCNKTLLAVQGFIRTPHFRHPDGSTCGGSLESYWHRIGKYILSCQNFLYLPNNTIFEYDSCDIQKRLFGFFPDCYLTNSRTGKSVIIEFFYSHKTEPDTLRQYLINGETVLQIDISSLMECSMTFQQFEDLVLKTGPREFLTWSELQLLSNNENIENLSPEVSEMSYDHNKYGSGSDWQDPLVWLRENWVYVLIGISVLIYFTLTFHKSSKSKGKTRRTHRGFRTNFYSNYR